MSHQVGKGNFINGRFIQSKGDEITSHNPARDFETVFSTTSALADVELAVEAAQKAFISWWSLSQEARNQHLLALKAAFIAREAEMARVISLEMGKILSESLAEARNLSARIDLMIKHGLSRVATQKPLPGGEARYHAQGPVTVIGPYNFPAHLVNAHVIPALLTGNTVVVKPSEVCPFVGQIYAECVAEAGLPAGVFNMVQGTGAVGRALVSHPRIRAVLFTGSYATGRAISELLLDQPHKIAALEMGGKNIAVVLDDADLNQALSEIVQGAFLTTGQRCTATSRLFLQRGIAERLTDSLVRVTKKLRPGQPDNPQTPFGPLATRGALQHFRKLANTAQACGAETLLENEYRDGGAFVTPSIRLLSSAKAKEGPYLKEELFGPDLCIEVFDHLDEAIERTNESAYGLSNALFSASQSAFERYYRETFSGVLNFNRSTNGALGQLPFGGVGKSGNQRAAGIDAVRYTTFPVAVNTLHYGESEAPHMLKAPLLQEKETLDLSVDDLANRHALENHLSAQGFQLLDARGHKVFLSLKQLGQLKHRERLLDGPGLIALLEPYAHVDDGKLCLTLPPASDFARFKQGVFRVFDLLADENMVALTRIPPQEVHIPPSALLPESDALLQRLYKDDFVPREKKTPVIDLLRSKGPYLCSVDEDPLVIFDAASQIASLGVGFQSGLFLNALDNGQLTASIIANPEHSETVARYTHFLLSHTWQGLKHVTFTSSGAESNEKAFDLCRLNGQQGKRIIAFEGSFHGRTLMALQATFNPQKRGLFEFAGYETTFVPYPSWTDPRVEPDFESDWIKSWHQGHIPSDPQNDPLLSREIHCLTKLKEEIEKGDVACVIVEPMQCEGGDNYATARFYNAVRALTRGLKVPLIFDEVQTGFGLLGPFYAHNAFNLRDIHGNVDGPDCVTLAKKAQLGVVLSAWPDKRPGPIHMLQVERGILQAEAMERFDTTLLCDGVLSRLDALLADYPEMISSPRAKGYAFAFDLPTGHLANELINQRFYRGFMVYVAGERTMRFRMNVKTTPSELDQLFAGIRRSFDHVRHFVQAAALPFAEAIKKYLSPVWTTDEAKAQPAPSRVRFTLAALNMAGFQKYEPQIAKLEEDTYEPGRRDSMAYLRSFVDIEGGLCLVMLDPEDRVIGYAIGGPLEHSQVDGPLQDPMRGKNNSFYSTNVLIAPHLRGQGLGLQLKRAQIEHVRQMKSADGHARYAFMSGRNRVGFTAEICAINRLFGAYSIKVYEKQYGDDEGKALYYRVPLRRPRLSLAKVEASTVLDWASPIQSPFGPSPRALFEDLQNGIFTPAIGTKLTLSNWVTPDFVRYAEMLRRLAPKACKHAFWASGRDEVTDKAVRCLRVARPKGQHVIGLRGQYLGTTTAVSRSLTEPSAYQAPFSWFDWPLVEHPSKVGDEMSLDAVEKVIQQKGAEQILGIFVELMGEKSANTVSDAFLMGLDRIRKATGVPIAFVETASGLGRNGHSLFFSDSQVIQPNLVLWYTGAQLGHLFADDAHYVAKPLTLISTWDGDEVSMLRNYRHMLLARESLKQGLASQFESALADAGLLERCKGRALWRAIPCKNAEAAKDLIERARLLGLLLKEGFDHHVMLTPHLASTAIDLKMGVDILRQSL